jgi:23S rRNA (adenine-N6)-dimethyltransferase
VASWPDRPLLELGAGDGALTEVLAALGRPLTAVEIDLRRVDRLRRRFEGRVDIVHGDLLDAQLSGSDIVSNVPFGITTPLLRRLLRDNAWHDALVLVQWEVARKRAGVGGTTMMTAQWWPWFEFDLVRRVPAAAFRPQPSVDGGLLHIRRREIPLIAVRDQRDYQRLVADVFSGRGRGVRDVVRRRSGASVASRWSHRHGISAAALPKDLTAVDWVGLFEAIRAGG